MAEITKHTEPRPSLLIAVMLTGVAIQLAAKKGWFDDWGAGQVIALLSAGWLIARNWYLPAEQSNDEQVMKERE